MGLRQTITLLFTTDFDASPFELWEIPVFMILGATCGILGAFFVYACRRVVEMRRKLSGHWLFKNNRYVALPHPSTRRVGSTLS